MLISAIAFALGIESSSIKEYKKVEDYYFVLTEEGNFAVSSEKVEEILIYIVS